MVNPTISVMNASLNSPVFVHKVKLEGESNFDDDDDSTLQDFITKAKRMKSDIDTRPSNTVASSFVDERKLNDDLSHVEVFDLESGNEICVVLDCTEESSITALRNSVDHILLSQDFSHEITDLVNKSVQEHKDHLIAHIKSKDINTSYDKEEVRLCSENSSQTIGRNLRKKRVEVSDVQKILAAKRELKSGDDNDDDDDDDDWTLDRWKQRSRSSVCKIKSTPALADSLSTLSQQSTLDVIVKTNEVEKHARGSDILGDTEAFSASTDELTFTEDQHQMAGIDHSGDIISSEEFYVNYSSIHNMPISRDGEDTMQYTMLSCLAASDTSPLGGSFLEAGASIEIGSSLEKHANHISDNSNGLLLLDERASIHCSSEEPSENLSSMKTKSECFSNRSLTVSEAECQAPDDAIAPAVADADRFQVELSPNFNRLISQGNFSIEMDKLSGRCRIPVAKNSSCLSSYPNKQESVKGVTWGGSVSKLPSKRKVKFDYLEDPGKTKGSDIAQDSCKDSLDLNGFSHLRDYNMHKVTNGSQSIVSENVPQPKSLAFSQMPTDSIQLVSQDDQSMQASNLALYSPCHLNHAPMPGSPLSQEQSPDPSTKFSLVLTSSPSPPNPASFKDSPDSPVKSSYLEKSEDTRPIRGILKQNLQHAVCNCAECQSVRSRAERAAKFSQQQLHDIQGLTGILKKELQSMRSLVEEILIHKCFSGSQLEQVKSVTSKALESEAVAKKWLVKMVRDCNRYCKLQETQKRKITFADEAGKQLCHVKHYQKNNNSGEHSKTLQLQMPFN